MVDRPSNYKSTRSSSRRTRVMRKFRDDDGRRATERRNDRVSARLNVRGDVAPRTDGQEIASSRGVTRVGSVSGRYTTRVSIRQATGVRVAGGDTIIRYQSGDVVIKRGARRAKFRNQILWLYALGYLLLFGSFIYWLLTGAVNVTPDEFIDRAFSRRQSSEVVELERAAMAAMQGNRTPAEVRLAEQVSFYDENKDLTRIEKGSRLTLLTAAKLGHAILKDKEREPAKREFQKPFRIYSDTHIANINWPHVMTLYNSLGFFLLLGIFLWRPLLHYLGTSGKKTAVALRNARDAQMQAEEYREKYRALAAEVEDKTEKLEMEVRSSAEKEQAAVLNAMREQALDMLGGVDAALVQEENLQCGVLGVEVARAACDQAYGILRHRLGQREHDAAIEELIADIAAAAKYR